METSCLICFEDLEGKIKATPNVCDHVFCLSCLEKWSKHGSFCPVDRKRFRKILNLDSENSIQVKPRKRKREKTVYDISMKCEVCLKDNYADVLLLCDCCDLGYHSFCLKPQLKTIPSGLWFCPTCVSVEAKLKKKNGVTKELEADLGNATLQLKKTKEEDDKKILSGERKQHSVEESSNLVKYNDARYFNNEECCNVKPCLNAVSEFQDINVAKKCYQNIYLLRSTNAVKGETENSSGCMKNAKTCGMHERKHKEYFSAHSEMCKNAEPHYTSSYDMCLKNTVLKDESLLDDCLSQAVVYGDMKIGIREENVSDACETMVGKSIQNLKYVHNKKILKPSYDVKKEILDVSSPSKGGSQSHSIKNISNENYFQLSNSNVNSFSKQRIQENSDHEDASNVNILPSCSSMPPESVKGIIKNFIISVESYFERPGIETIKSKTKEGHLNKRYMHFSVFEKLEGNDASQKKYSEINSRTGISFSSNLNIGHCFLCKDTILVDSQNFCKICKLKYMNNSKRNEKNSKSTKSSNQEFESSSMSNKLLNFHYQGSTRKKRSALEKRQYSLVRNLRKIHNAQKKLIDTTK